MTKAAPAAARVGERSKRRRAHVLWGLLLVLAGAMTMFVSWASAVPACETDPQTGRLPLESRGTAVAITSSVLEFNSGTGGLFCEKERVLRVHTSARPTGRKPLFLGVGGVVATRRYLGASQYELAATDMSALDLLDTRRAGDSAQGLAAPDRKPFWRSYAISSAKGAGGRACLTHQWRAVGAEPFAAPRFGTPPSERFWLVAMNADGSPGVAADLRLEVELAPKSEWPRRIGMVAGLGLAIAGLALAVRSVIPGTRRQRARSDGSAV